MARSTRLNLFCVFFVFLFVTVCENACCQEALEVRGDLALESPFIGPPGSGPASFLAQKAIEQPVQNAQRQDTPQQPTEKSPGKAFIFSFLAPGSGELYVGAKRGYIFLGVEAVAWASSYFFDQSGDKKETEFERFADQHWTFPEPGTVGPGGSVYTAERDSMMREFYDHNKQHYYEDIGKQPFNLPGWDSTQDLKSYLDMRDKSNWLLKNSDYALMAALVNHVVSAVDALRLARNYNANLGHGMKLNLKFKTSPHSAGVMVVASRKF